MKAYTAMGIMRLVQDGKIGLNDTLQQHVDWWLQKTNSTTLLELWKQDKRVNDITIYHLLHMRAGLLDYSSSGMRTWTIQNPNKDFSPLDYLYTLNKTFLCDPGNCQQYSSNGYELLGFVLAAHSNATSWDTFDFW